VTYLDPKLREKVERMADDRLIYHLDAPEPAKVDRHAIVRDIAARAAEIGVEHMKELVCSECGLTRDEAEPIGGWCNVGGNYCGDFVKITRAEYERRKEGK